MTRTLPPLDSPVAAYLERRLAAPLTQAPLARPLRQFLSRPGKQLRAKLVELSWALAGGAGLPPPQLPLAVELLHAGSLIVDDIEDCADERRGGPALHLDVGLPVALNAGNWLYFAALEQLGELPLSSARALLVLRRANATLAACHEGQALDVGVRISGVAQRDVPALVAAIAERKTGGLSSLCASLAAICAHAPPRVVQALNAFGEGIGAGLQILDDTGAIHAESRRDKAEEDLRNGRATSAWALLASSLPAADYQRLQQTSARAESGEVPACSLLETMRGLLPRRAGHDAAADRLATSLGALRTALGPSRALDEAARLIAMLEESYG